jgi:hypothetical protein
MKPLDGVAPLRPPQLLILQHSISFFHIARGPDRPEICVALTVSSEGGLAEAKGEATVLPRLFFPDTKERIRRAASM